MVIEILGVVVVYNRKIGETRTVKSLLDNFRSSDLFFKNFNLLIHDNSRENQGGTFTLPFKHKYFHAASNDGLSIAYNNALSEAVKNNSDWLLLLDQDSTLPANFLESLLYELMNIKANQEIVAVVPKMYYKGCFFSPSKVLYGGIHRPIDMNFTGVYPEEIFAIGSGSLLKTSFFRNIGGFNEFFWLDCLDRWIYLQIFKKGGQVLVSDIRIEHELSVMDYSSFIDEKRYSNIIKYETYFMRFYKTPGENLIYYLRLFKRSAGFLLKKGTLKFAIITIKHLADLIFHPLRYRKIANQMKIK